MTGPAIRITGISKQYALGERQASYRTLRESFARAARAPLRWIAPRRSADARAALWALKDVSLEIGAGDVVGLIGRNGAGKSTLLKLLSRVTEPTEGRIEIRGRVGSLLEVGTGFHPELTGRENVFLSGAILGMRRSALLQRFDEIVEFSEIGEFIDTPVKHYSSGMHVRLGFAVAAHLDTDVLLVDEVLAVGDARFQGKCIAKMADVQRSGRTILFVSHNLAIVNALCDRAVLLSRGQVAHSGPTADVVARYLESVELREGRQLSERSERSGTGEIRFTELRLLDAADHPIDVMMSCQRVRLALSYRAAGESPLENVFVQIAFSTAFGQRLFVCLTRATQGNFASLPGAGTIVCDVPRLPLAPGGYRVGVLAKVREVVADEIEDAANVTVVEGDCFGTGRLPPASSGPFLVDHRWSLDGGSAVHLRTFRDPPARS